MEKTSTYAEGLGITLVELLEGYTGVNNLLFVENVEMGELNTIFLRFIDEDGNIVLFDTDNGSWQY